MRSETRFEDSLVNNSIVISVFEVVGSPLSVASGDGQKVYERIASVLRANRHVSLSFLNVSTITSAFLNSAIGQLYGEFDESVVRQLLSVEDIQPNDVKLLQRVVETAKQYFANQEEVTRIVNEELGADPCEE